jgi:hypothetical protein
VKEFDNYQTLSRTENPKEKSLTLSPVANFGPEKTSSYFIEFSLGTLPK